MLRWRSCTALWHKTFVFGERKHDWRPSVGEELWTLFSWELTPDVNPDQVLPLWHLTPHPQTRREWHIRRWRQGCAGAGGEHEEPTGSARIGPDRWGQPGNEQGELLGPVAMWEFLPRYCQSFWFFNQNKFIQWVLNLGTIVCVYIYIYVYNPYVHELCSVHRHMGYVSWQLQCK